MSPEAPLFLLADGWCRVCGRGRGYLSSRGNSESHRRTGDVDRTRLRMRHLSRTDNVVACVSWRGPRAAILEFPFAKRTSFVASPSLLTSFHRVPCTPGATLPGSTWFRALSNPSRVCCIPTDMEATDNSNLRARRRPCLLADRSVNERLCGVGMIDPQHCEHPRYNPDSSTPIADRQPAVAGGGGLARCRRQVPPSAPAGRDGWCGDRSPSHRPPPPPAVPPGHKLMVCPAGESRVL